MSRHGMRLLAVAAAVGLAATACGGSSGGNTTASGGTSSGSSVERVDHHLGLDGQAGLL